MSRRDDVTGEHAVKLAECAYMRARMLDRPADEIDDLREFICLARGWEYRK